ncbi:TetR/AcrR family transcriptional regulator [Subtercola endophyticus]|uniref:TetR/AcrR family transcriptional regulator n=1 Tax=Subtercola endophyticus TaxID=2895559 RepID=UPI001E5E2DED|nr:TetR/AcrR family transcriptional regulator [Subtercola endophyticus]UFS60659.1 TetR/AcrR family transcriptional regulator [Subtercola endophyticus]
MTVDTARARAMDETRNRILDVARELLGQNPDASMSDVAAAAGVVRRTVYGHFPSRSDLVLTLADQAVKEIEAVLQEVNLDGVPADEVWARFVERLWPLTHRYRVLLALRRGEHGDEIHALLGSVDEILTDLVARGQNSGVFGRHLPAETLGQIAYAAVFTIADDRRGDPALDVRAATITSLLVLGVPETRAYEVIDPPAASGACPGPGDVGDEARADVVGVIEIHAGAPRQSGAVVDAAGTERHRQVE